MLMNIIKKLNKKALEGDVLIKWIIALFILALCIVLIIIFSKKGNVILDKLKGIFMFRS